MQAADATEEEDQVDEGWHHEGEYQEDGNYA